jgi:hypothetical protein
MEDLQGRTTSQAESFSHPSVLLEVCAFNKRSPILPPSSYSRGEAQFIPPGYCQGHIHPQSPAYHPRTRQPEHVCRTGRYLFAYSDLNTSECLTIMAHPPDMVQYGGALTLPPFFPPKWRKVKQKNRDRVPRKAMNTCWQDAPTFCSLHVEQDKRNDTP